MAVKQFSVSIDDDKLAQLDVLRSDGDGRRSRNNVVNDAIDLYLELHSWQIGHIRKGLEEADRGEYVPRAEMEAFFDELLSQKSDR